MMKFIEQDWGELFHFKPPDVVTAYAALVEELAKTTDNPKANPSNHILVFSSKKTDETFKVDGLNKQLKCLLWMNTKKNEWGVRLNMEEPCVTIHYGKRSSPKFDWLDIKIGEENGARKIHALLYWINFLSL